ncbi:hypothetical protein ATEIFO6365_0006065600 [Aspergillus terreus]|uniref:Uncharacterized protein n=1 Tax=Aspergillus terreus TaxID=33178 RepID=A0A5M3YXJ6_ASPTE|nr:hypothetical protein ATETN484_0005065600 [Aspergillus terreus]GFF17308.1 hypothetical protein ATEIFO6365_0006065600 [Aspergillus terreus]
MSHLTADDLEIFADDNIPVIAAAANPNIAILEAILTDYERFDKRSQGKTLTRAQKQKLCSLSPNISVDCKDRIHSPIITAIGANLPDHLRLLLAAGADPNGIKLFSMADYSVEWIRGRHFHFQLNLPRRRKYRVSVLETARKEGITHPVCPLTGAELDERRHGLPRFWTEPIVPGQGLRMPRPLTSLEVAAELGNTEMIDILRVAGAEESAWLQPAASVTEQDVGRLFDIQDEDDVPFSALSTSSPVHEAIAAGRVMMLRHLLDTCGYSPNYCPRAAPTVALPPLSYAIARCDLSDPGVQRCLVDLLSHPQLNPNIRTAIFNVHALHFATAHHDPELLRWLAGFMPAGLGAAGTTALGHTLLHVASLPLTRWQVNGGNPKVAQSIHCIRTLDARWRHPHRPSARFGLGVRNPRPMTESQQQAQKATVQVLLDWGGCDVGAQDVDGNTALHYLAGTLNIDVATIMLVRGIDGGERVWQETENRWGLTPSDLCIDRYDNAVSHTGI